jgi:hypothetical protein
MAKVRYHLGPQGPGVCRVDTGNARSKGCPFGGESGSENHFATMAEAEVAYADQMEASGNGLVAASASSTSRAATPDLQTQLQGVFRNRFDILVADSYYGVSADSEGGFVADSSEGLERLKSQFVASVDHEIDPEIDYADEDQLVISSVHIEELGINIKNQNIEDDLQSLHDDREMVAANGREYWR